MLKTGCTYVCTLKAANVPEHSVVNPVALLKAVLQDAMSQQPPQSKDKVLLIISQGRIELGQ
jgi:hypothetical protein